MSDKVRSSSASSRVDELKRAESRMSTLDKPPQYEGESRASYGWRLLRASVRFAVDASKKSDIYDMMVSHGVHHLRSMVHPTPLTQLIYNKCTKEYLSYDGKDIRTFSYDGRRKNVVRPQAEFTRLICAYQLSLFVGWTENGDDLTLMNSAFEVNSTSAAPGPILCAVFNENLSEVVTIGPGCLTTWVFRYGGRHLLPRHTTSDGLLDNDNFTILALEETASRAQRAYLASETTVCVMNLFEGRMLSRKKELHTRAITCLTLFNPLKYLITGAKDGSIKVWDERWHLQVVFVGHAAEVTSLSVYPFGPNFMSASNDKTIRVWSLETCDQVLKVEADEPPQFIGSVINVDQVHSYSRSNVHLWTVNHIHTLHTTIGHRIQLLKSTDHPEYPIRSYFMCRDSSVRIVSPLTGNVITTLLMEPRRHLVDAAYAIAQNNLFAVFGNGDIVKCDTSTNPCTVLATWPCKNEKSACNYLLVYEYVITADMDYDVWAGMKRAAATKGLGSEGNSANRTLLLGGRKDGHICVFNWKTGRITFEIEAHGTKGVLSMIANSKADQLISAGLDNIIKVWRLFPYAEESLAPLMSFYCAHTPIYMTVLRNKLAVAFQEHTSATYSVVMYNIRGKNRLDHSPDDDHYDSITGLTSCNKLKLVASCSNDCTVRIWNEENELIRIIQLNAVPRSICFCSDRGDLLVGIGKHVHKIERKKYLPKSYGIKLVSLQFRDEIDEKPLPLDTQLLAGMQREDIKRLKAAQSSFKFTHFMDILTDEENEEVMRERKMREHAFALLDVREAELLKIKEGELPASHKPRPTADTKREAFDKYLRLFYDRPRVELYEEDQYALEEALGTLTRVESEKALYQEKETMDFFPAASTAVKTIPRPENIADETPEKVPPPVRPGGSLPNSVLVRILFPLPRSPPEKEDTYQPPTFTSEQLLQIAGGKSNKWKKLKKRNLARKKVKKPTREESFQDRTLVMSWDDDEEEEEEDEEKEEQEERSRVSTASELPAAASMLLDKVQTMMSKEPSPTPTPEPSLPSTPLEKQSTTSSIPRPSRLPSKKSLVKFAPPPKPPITPKRDSQSVFLTETPPSRSLVKTPPPRTPGTPPPRQDTPLPDFISQFVGQDWFDQYFPNCNANTMPKPWSVDAFVTMLLRVLKIAEYMIRVRIVEALQQINDQDTITNKSDVQSTLHWIFKHPQHAPDCSDAVERDFITRSLELMLELGHYDKDFYMDTIVLFLNGDKVIRQRIVDIWKRVGMRGSQECLVRETDKWDAWNIPEEGRITQLYKLCSDWLDKVMADYKKHMETVQKDGAQSSVSFAEQRSELSSETPHPPDDARSEDARSSQERSRSRGILKKHPEQSDESFTVEGTHMSRSARARKLEVVKVSDLTYTAALNHFCDVENLGNLVLAERPAKNTVLVLPKVPGKTSLVRLGDTHTSKCRRDRETNLEHDLHLPPLTQRGPLPAPGELYHFPLCINLPMKQIVMNPFPQPWDIDDPTLTRPLLLTLKTAQKYFIHSRSYASQDTF